MIESLMLLTQHNCHCHMVAPSLLHYRYPQFPSLSYCSTPWGKHACELMNGPLISPSTCKPSAHFQDMPLAHLLTRYACTQPTTQSADLYSTISLWSLLRCAPHTTVTLYMSSPGMLPFHLQHSPLAHHPILQFSWVSDPVPNPVIVGDQVW